MKRQLGTMLTAAMLLCASLAWSQSNDTSSSQAGYSSSSQPLFTNSSTSAWTNAQNGSFPSDPTQSNPAQSDTTQSNGSDNGTQTGSSGPQDTFTHPEQLPSLGLFSDAVHRAGVSLTASVSSIAQYVSYTGTPAAWDTLNNFSGGISIAQYRPNYGFLLNYSAGLDLTSGYSVNETLLNQSGYFGGNWNFAKRWQLRVKDSYFYSDNPFTPFLTYLGNPTPNNPNPVAYFPQAVVESNTAHLDLTYRLGPHDLLNFNAGENFQKYLRGSAIALWNSTNYSEGAFYQHNYSAQLSFGGGYQFAALDFGHGQSRSGVSTFEGFLSYVFNSHVNGSLWIGPESTSTKNIIPVLCNQFGCFVEIFHQQSWSVAEGGTFQWKISPRDELDFQGSRGVSNSGGILGAANIYQAVLSYSRPVNRVWNFGVGLNYSYSKSVSTFRAEQYLKSLSGTVGFSRDLFNRSCEFNAYYALIKQSQNYFSAPTNSATSGLGFTLRYVWDHGLGG